MWWIAARRRARQNLLVPVLAAGLWAIVGFHTLRIPAARADLHLSAVLAAGLLAAVLLPVHFRGENVFASARWGLLPFSPRLIWLLRPLLGDPLRLLSTLGVAFWGWVGIARLDLAPLPALGEAVQWAGWVGAGLLGAELLDEVLRRRRSLLLLEAEMIAFVLAASVLVQSAAERAELLGGVTLRGAWAAPLLGGGAPPSWELLVACGLLAAVGALLALAMRLAERFARTPPPEPRGTSWGAAIGALARRAAPHAPARLAKELASVLRIPLLRLNYLLAAALAGFAVWRGVPMLLAFAWLFWVGFAFNLLGPIARRHRAVLLTTALLAAGAGLAGLVLRALGSPVVGGSPVLAYPLWLAFGASAFLLVTVPGDRFSPRAPRPMRVRQLIDEGSAAGGALEGVFALLALVAALAVAALGLVLWSAALSAILPGAARPSRLALALGLGAATNLLLYAAVRRRAHAG